MKKRHYHRQQHHIQNGFFLSFLDGLEGGFAIFAGIVVGLSFSDVDRTTLIVTALVGILVNAVNAATIRYSTEHYRDELDGHEKRSPFKHYFLPAFSELMAYIVVSCLALTPLLFVSHLETALVVMVTSCLAILFVAGAARGQRIGRHWLRDGFEVMLGGLLMIVIGAMAGFVLARAFGA